MRLGLITYDVAHLKTEQVALGLARRGVGELAFFALSFKPRPPRKLIFEHRPDMSTGVHPAALAAALDAPYQLCADADAIAPDAADLFLITGAGLLPPMFVRATTGRVVNAHPGLIPAVRGLDALKWAIYDCVEVGNTLHFIDEEADAGELIARRATPVFRSDTLASFARRHYELEIAMMVEFDRYLDGDAELAKFDETLRPARMRMPADLQLQLEDRFEAYKERFARA